MTYPAYPDGLRGILLSGQSISRASNFEMADPLYGPAYTRKTTDDTPVFIKGSLIFNASDARRFNNFLRDINYGFTPFTMPIMSEYGVVEQTCQAMPNSFNPQPVGGGNWRYNIDIVIADFQLPPLADYADSFTEIDWYVPDSFGIFDTAINAFMPKG